MADTGHGAGAIRRGGDALCVRHWVYHVAESIVYMHGLLFMMAAADTLLNDQHVRVDIFYARRSRFRAGSNQFAGTCFYAAAFCVLIVIVSWDYVSISWSVREGSRETSGIQGVFLLKSVILVFAVQMALQAVSFYLTKHPSYH